MLRGSLNRKKRIRLRISRRRKFSILLISRKIQIVRAIVSPCRVNNRRLLILIVRLRRIGGRTRPGREAFRKSEYFPMAVASLRIPMVQLCSLGQKGRPELLRPVKDRTVIETRIVLSPLAAFVNIHQLVCAILPSLKSGVD